MFSCPRRKEPFKGLSILLPKENIKICVYFLANENKFCFSYSFAQGEYFFLTLLQGFETNTDIADISRTVRIRNQFSLAQGENINDLSKTVTDSSNTLQESVLFCVQRFL